MSDAVPRPNVVSLEEEDNIVDVDAADEQPPADIADELRNVNQQLLLAGLVAQEQAEEAQRDLTFQRELERQKENFLLAVAHDFRTPLSTVKGYTQLLLRRLDRGETLDVTQARENLNQIDSAVMRMVTQVDELLARHLRQPAQTLDHSTSAVDLSELVSRVVSEYQATRQNSHIELRTEGAAMLGSWKVLDLESTLSNLLSNAIKYSPEGGQIEVSLRREDGADGPRIVLAVRDQGMGIPASDLPHIFERYYRASNAADLAGTGIGLAAVSDTVAHYGGTVSVEPNSDRGMTFTVRLPLGAPHGSSAG